MYCARPFEGEAEGAAHVAQACRPPCRVGFSQRVFVHRTGWGDSLREGHTVGGVWPPGPLGSRLQAPGEPGDVEWPGVLFRLSPGPGCFRGIVIARGLGGGAAEVASVCAGGRLGEMNPAPGADMLVSMAVGSREGSA